MQNIDTLWILVAAILVFLMQSGFTSYEIGLIRAKNSLNVAFKNISDFVIAILAFWAVGFALMFGASSGGWFGGSGFFLQGVHTSHDYAFFIFQLMFAGTAATIVSGAVAERMKFKGYLLSSLCITALIYPVSGHWIWGSAFDPAQVGWLEQIGFVDFAGSTVVHSVGGWLGLVAAWVLGPRIGRFDAHGVPQPIPSHNLATSTIGVFILWFGWFGFNGGSTLQVNEQISTILLNTLLSPAAAALTCMLLSLWISRGEQIEITKVLNSIIAGLVGITAGCAWIEPQGAIVVGVVSALLLWTGEWFLLHRLKIDDPVGAVTAHGVVGVWGTLAVALLAPAELLPLRDTLAQLWVQMFGAGVIFLWTIACGVILFTLLKWLDFLRVSEEEELKGLNVSEHGATTVWNDTLNAMQRVAVGGDLQRPVAVEPGTEAGEMAKSFNSLLSQVNRIFSEIDQELRQATEGDEIQDAPAGIESNLSGVRDGIQQKTTALSRLNRSLKADALYDDLTELPNRRLLMDRMRQRIAQCERDQEQMAVLFIDLDNFKRVNDELGHKQGDLLLQEVAASLLDSVREVDTVARLGGDEFVVLMAGWAKQTEIDRVVQRILHAIGRSYSGKQGEIIVSGSIGIALYPENGDAPERLLEQADHAMYQAKESGKGCFCYL